MPFGNETGMADVDRDRFGQWIAAQ
jgi:hypothetical protein